MFTENYSAENAIKRLAKIVYGVSLIFAGICLLGALIVIGIDAEYLWWIGLLIIVGGALVVAASLISAIFLWGFAEIIANTKKSASGVSALPDEEDNALPEL